MADGSGLRLRGVRFKSGGSIRMLPGHDPKPGRTIVETALRKMLDSAIADPAGCAMVVWDREGRSSAIIRNRDASPLLSMQIPSFVKARLTYDITERWIFEGIRDQWGLPGGEPEDEPA